MSYKVKLSSGKIIDIRRVKIWKISGNNEIVGASITLKNDKKLIASIDDIDKIRKKQNQYEVFIGNWNNKRFEAWVPKNITNPDKILKIVLKQRKQQTVQ